MTTNYDAKNAAARLIAKIEGGVDPFEVATGLSSAYTDELQDMIYSLGGRADIRQMTPAGVALYLLSLIVVND